MRSPKQIRNETAYHEAGHLAAGFVLGRRIERAMVMNETELEAPEVQDADYIGRVWFEDRQPDPQPSSLGDAVDDIVIDLAGEAGQRIAWTVGMVTDEEVGARVVPDDELSTDALLASTNGRTPEQRSVSLGFYMMPAKGDEANALATAEAWTSDGLEAQALLGFASVRTANLVATESFQRLLHTAANALLEHGELNGELAHHLLDRMAVVAGLPKIGGAR